MVRVMFSSNYNVSMFILIIESTSMGHIEWQTYSKVASLKWGLMSLNRLCYQTYKSYR